VAKTPEQWLEVASPPKKVRGSLKVFLGYAPGVGKTFTMLSEAIRRHSRGENVVIGVVETHGRMSHPRGTPVSPDNSKVRNTWPNLVFPDDDFVRQYSYVLNW